MKKEIHCMISCDKKFLILKVKKVRKSKNKIRVLIKKLALLPNFFQNRYCFGTQLDKNEFEKYLEEPYNFFEDIYDSPC